MIETYAQIFSIENFMPHGHCYLWNPTLLWSMVISNSVIALSYYSIPVALMITVKRRDNDTLKWVFYMFSAFIFACGTTHIINIVTIWYPNYWLDAGAKLTTAGISAVTAIALWPIVNRAKAYIAVQERNTEELRGSNHELKESVHSLRQQRSDFQTLNNMSGVLHVCNNMEEISATMIQTLSSLWPESTGAFYLLESNDSNFTLADCWGESVHPEHINSVTCWAYRLAKPFPDCDMTLSKDCEVGKCGMTSEKICLPVIGGGETLGLLHLQGLSLPLDDRNETILHLLIERAGLAIYNMRLQESLEFKSTRDSLTELFNRRYLDEALEIEINRASRNNSELTLIMFDLDHFKKLNDNHGHDAGDQALRLFSRVIRSNLRSGDVACRFGGEEFVLILPGSDSVNAEILANRVRVELENRSHNKEEKAFFGGLTVSAGLATYSNHCRTAEELLHRADQALYKAKANGRNTIVVA